MLTARDSIEDRVKGLETGASNGSASLIKRTNEPVPGGNMLGYAATLFAR